MRRQKERAALQLPFSCTESGDGAPVVMQFMEKLESLSIPHQHCMSPDPHESRIDFGEYMLAGLSIYMRASAFQESRFQ
jgi:hypothetical protein